MTLRVRTRRLELPGSPLAALPRVDDALVWIRRDEGLVAWGNAVRLDVPAGADRFTAADAELVALADAADIDDDVRRPGTGLVGFGSFAFDDDAAGSVLLVPRVVVGRRGHDAWVTTIDPPDAQPVAPPATSRTPPEVDTERDRPRYAGSSNPDLFWLEAVARAVERIEAGELEKVVLARDHAVWSHTPFDPLDLASRLSARFPRCYTFVVDGLVGATPELLLSRTGDRVVSRALAGTTGRSDDEVEDAALGAALLASDKDLREHRYAADSVREVLEPRCASLTYDPSPRLVRMDNVQHLATSFDGQLAGEQRSLEIVAALHPTAAVGGTPRDAALAMIRELEGMDRGRYAAPVGWTDANGDGEWGIALRCAELTGARARLFAGVGIVDASLPEAELEETRLKLLAMQAAMDATPPA